MRSISWKTLLIERVTISKDTFETYLLMTRKYLLTAHNDVYFSSVKYKVICALTLLWIGKREEPKKRFPRGMTLKEDFIYFQTSHLITF